VKNLREPTKPDLRKPIDTQARGLRGGAYEGPRVNKGRDDIYAVRAYEPGHKGATKPKLRKPWYK
jgi:hypothetical protein